MHAKELSQALANQAAQVAEYLLPGGKKKGAEWRVGSVAGEAGDSLGVHLTGHKAGVWRDFSAEIGGDLLDLWMAVRGCNLPDAIREAKAFLGVHDVQLEQAPKAWKRPPQKAPEAKPEAPAMRWLKSERGISDEAIAAYRVGVSKDGRAVVFPHYRGGEMVNFKLRDHADKKRMMTFGGGEPCLWGWQAIADDARSIVICEGECFPGDAEILTPSGWVALSSYERGQVAQYRDGEIQWVDPVCKVQREFNGRLIRYETRGYVSITTPGHNLLSVDKHGIEYKHRAEDGPRSGAHRIPRTGVLNGSGICLTDAQIRLCIAVSADAAIDVRKNTYAGGVARRLGKEARYAKFGLKKDRKVQRLRDLLSQCGIEASDTSIANGYSSICFALPEWVPGRMLPWEWIASASAKQREMILSELVLWDGNSVQDRNQHEFSSKHRENVDWVQALCHTTGRVSSVICRENACGKWFKASILHGKQFTSWQRLHDRAEFIDHNGDVFCVQVPSGALVVRQEGKVTISGNCDAMVMWQYGYPALSVFSGVSNLNWIETDHDRLDQFSDIVLCMDMDEPGQAAAKKIAERLGLERCRIAELPHKDANECLKAGVPAETIRQCIDQARFIAPDELRNAADFTDLVIECFYPTDDRPIGLLFPWIKAAGKLALRTSELSIWTGINGHGKSQMLGQVVIHAMSQGELACIASMELKPERLLYRMVRQMTGAREPSRRDVIACMEWMRDRAWIFNAVGTASAARILEVFAYARKRYGVTQFVIDSLMKCGIADDDYNGQKAFVDRLCDFKEQHDCHVHLVAHSRKKMNEDGAPGKMDIKGSGSIGDLADNLFSVWRNKKKEAGDDTGVTYDAILHCDKQRHGEWEGALGFYFDRDSFQYLEEERELPRRMDFLVHAPSQETTEDADAYVDF